MHMQRAAARFNAMDWRRALWLSAIGLAGWAGVSAPAPAQAQAYQYRPDTILALIPYSRLKDVCDAFGSRSFEGLDAQAGERFCALVRRHAALERDRSKHDVDSWHRRRLDKAQGELSQIIYSTPIKLDQITYSSISHCYNIFDQHVAYYRKHHNIEPNHNEVRGDTCWEYFYKHLRTDAYSKEMRAMFERWARVPPASFVPHAQFRVVPRPPG